LHFDILSAFDKLPSAPSGPEPFGLELMAERLMAERLMAERPVQGNRFDLGLPWRDVM